MPTLDSFRTFIFRSASVDPWKRSISALHMPERFGRDARMVSFLAHERAFRLRHDCVGIDHLLLALLENDRALALLQNSGANADVVRLPLALRMVPGLERTKRDAVLPKSSVLHKAWGDAHVIADRQGARLIEPEHLLLALVVPDKAGRLSNTARKLIASGFGRT